MITQMPEKEIYVKALLQMYLALPETPFRFSRYDHKLAEQLYDQNVKLEEVEAALLMATARRLFRTQLPRLSPIRSLHYFLPVIHELQQTPLVPSYLHYLRRTVEQRLKSVPL